MNERCPKCKARNSRIRSEVEVNGWPIPDDYCGVCGVNWPRPAREDIDRKVVQMHEDNR